MDDPEVTVRPVDAGDWPWITANIADIGGSRVVSAGVLYDLRDYTTLVAENRGELAGVITIREEESHSEILAIKAMCPARGIGTALLRAAIERARSNGARSVAVSTTNDNTGALRFYQRHGFTVVAYQVGGFSEVVRVKRMDPDEVYRGHDGIPIRDTLELVLDLTSYGK